ncbi:MAG: pyridoxal phosphate-dependent aminotransferase [Clostridia bacterium]|nr:pyridoxal phosphate-dependent aminotransferase [Clostridia bacterium]
MMFDKAYFDAGVNRIGTDCEKWDGMIAATGDPDMIPMWVADMDFPSPPAIKEAMAKVLDWNTWGYTIAGKRDAQALKAYWARRHGVEFDVEDVLMSPCVVTGLRLCVRALTNPGDGVLITTPVYGPFFAAVKGNEHPLIESPMIMDEVGRFTLDLADIEAKLSSGAAKLVLFCSPHNPCGRAWSEEELKAVLDLCAKYNVPMVCDEIHADFVYAPGKHHSIMSIEGAADHAVMLCAASKTFNVAGLQQSSIVCKNGAWRKAIASEMENGGVRSGNAFALAATRAAYTDCDEWLDGLKAYLADNRDYVVEYVKESMPKIKVTPLEATYLMWLDCRKLNMPQKDLIDALLAQHVKVNDGTIFGKEGDGFIRLNIACPRAQLERALKAMAKVLG